MGMVLAGLKGFGRYLFVSQTNEINTCILSLPFRHFEEISQPIEKATQNPGSG
jgi:hypothetical protein